MKRFHPILTLVAITLLGLSAFTLTACSGDEAEAPAQTKADLLRAKAKEFAKKYGVDMSLNANCHMRFDAQSNGERTTNDISCNFITGNTFGILGSGFIRVETGKYKFSFSCIIDWDEVRGGSLKIS